MKEINETNVVYLIGENAKDNWKLLDSSKKQNMNWFWFHLDSNPSAYVILCLTKKELHGKTEIKKAAELCKNSSKFRNLPKIGVIYTELKNVKKTGIVGQVITKKTQRIVI